MTLGGAPKIYRSSDLNDNAGDINNQESLESKDEIRGYEVTRDFKNECNSINLDKGNVISVEEYETLSLGDKDAFFPVNRTK